MITIIMMVLDSKQEMEEKKNTHKKEKYPGFRSLHILPH